MIRKVFNLDQINPYFTKNLMKFRKHEIRFCLLTGEKIKCIIQREVMYKNGNMLNILFKSNKIPVYISLYMTLKIIFFIKINSSFHEQSFLVIVQQQMAISLIYFAVSFMLVHWSSIFPP